MKTQQKLAFALLLIQLLFVSCIQDDEQPDPNLPPKLKATVVAKAGPDQTIVMPENSTYLGGSQSTFTSAIIIAYGWTKISGPATFRIGNAAADRTLLSDLVEGEYQFELKVTAEGEISSKDTVRVLVVDESGETVESPLWTSLGYLPDNDFFLGPTHWFNGFNFLMGAGNRLFAVSINGNLWEVLGANSWKIVGKFPAQMESTPVVFNINDKGYCLGEGRLWQYDPGENAWQSIKNVPSSLKDARFAMVIQGKAILIGGTNQVTEYDPITNTFTPRSSFPGKRLATGFVINGKGLCIGDDGRCWEFDPSTNSWQEKAGLFPGIVNLSGFSLKGYGYVIGDLKHSAYNHNQPMKVWRYDPTENQWLWVDKVYPGSGAYLINAITFEDRVYVGLGVNNGDFNATDLWQVN